jgi:class 3 adenylate cyclase
VLSRWQKLGLDVGLGIGLASGYVARLCALAESGQILADQRTVGLIGDNGGVHRFEKLDPVALKGFARAVTVFVVNP